ncbi:unnamed protein product [Vicia faba]|uniref:Uncharacterized protein n=1 Tax=Vicia faba TaxID=3906 RepID=A0AAV1A1Q4_VICFA|nr:unnamed protein product [Vicia faba]
MKMRFALAGSCRREDIPACGRGRGTGLLGFKKLTLAAISDSITPERIILRASRLRASSQASYFVRGLTIDSIAQISLVVLRADSGTASIPRGALTLAAFSFTTLSITTDFSSYGSKLSQVPSLPSCLFDRSLHSLGEFFYIKE